MSNSMKQNLGNRKTTFLSNPREQSEYVSVKIKYIEQLFCASAYLDEVVAEAFNLFVDATCVSKLIAKTKRVGY